MPSYRTLLSVTTKKFYSSPFESGDYPDHCAQDYEKVVTCRHQAQREGFKYVWVDTCCIDNSSSAALSKAINSMLKFYE